MNPRYTHHPAWVIINSWPVLFPLCPPHTPCPALGIFWSKCRSHSILSIHILEGQNIKPSQNTSTPPPWHQTPNSTSLMWPHIQAMSLSLQYLISHNWPFKSNLSHWIHVLEWTDVSHRLLCIGPPSVLTFWPLTYSSVGESGLLVGRVPNSLNFADATSVESRNVLSCPLCFLQVGKRRSLIRYGFPFRQERFMGYMVYFDIN